jgi:hypothetical protein
MISLAQYPVFAIAGESKYKYRDGQVIRYRDKHLCDHLDYFKDFYIQIQERSPEIEFAAVYADKLARLGFVIFKNSLIKKDDKYEGIIFLPEKLSSSQIEMLLQLQPILYKIYNPNFFDVIQAISDNFSYNIEIAEQNRQNISDSKDKYNGLDLLYNKINDKKQVVKQKIL